MRHTGDQTIVDICVQTVEELHGAGRPQIALHHKGFVFGNIRISIIIMLSAMLRGDLKGGNQIGFFTENVDLSKRCTSYRLLRRRFL